MDEWTQLENSAPASRVAVVWSQQSSAVDIAVQAGQQRLDGLGRPFRTSVTKILSFDNAAGQVQCSQMSRKNVIQALQNAGLGQFNEARVNRFNLHRELENFFKHKSSMPLAISQQKLHSLMNPA